ncbi:MAG: hypothetical protein ABW187_01405, partial [Dokdonella sp.]
MDAAFKRLPIESDELLPRRQSAPALDARPMTRFTIMFLAHRKPTFAAALAVFSIALPLGNLAFAQFDSSTTIANAERAAQSVIVSVPSPTRSHVELPAASSEAVTLAQNERAAQRAIVGVPFSRTATLPGRYDTLGGVSLARAERAAQQVIVGAP